MQSTRYEHVASRGTPITCPHLVGIVRFDLPTLGEEVLDFMGCVHLLAHPRVKDSKAQRAWVLRHERCSRTTNQVKHKHFSFGFNPLHPFLQRARVCRSQQPRSFLSKRTSVVTVTYRLTQRDDAPRTPFEYEGCALRTDCFQITVMGDQRFHGGKAAGSESPGRAWVGADQTEPQSENP